MVSLSDQDPLDIREQLARIDQMRVDQQKTYAETAKLWEEQRKAAAETAKLWEESRHVARDYTLRGYAIAATFGGALVAAAGVVWAAWLHH